MEMCSVSTNFPVVSKFAHFASCSWTHAIQNPRKLTPNAEKRFRLGCGSCLLRKTSDLGRGGFFGRIITRVSSRMSSSSNLLSDETDNCLCTWPCSVVDQSGTKSDTDEDKSPKMSKQNIFLPHNGARSELQFPKHVTFIKFHCCSSSEFICRAHVRESDGVEQKFRIFILAFKLWLVKFYFNGKSFHNSESFNPTKECYRSIEAWFTYRIWNSSQLLFYDWVIQNQFGVRTRLD